MAVLHSRFLPCRMWLRSDRSPESEYSQRSIEGTSMLVLVGAKGALQWSRLAGWESQRAQGEGWGGWYDVRSKIQEPRGWQWKIPSSS